MACRHLGFNGNLVPCMTWHAALERHAPCVHVGPGKDFFPAMAGLAVSGRNIGQALRHPGSGARKGEETKNTDKG